MADHAIICAQAFSFQQQEGAAAELRAQIAKDPGNPNLHLQLATALHGLDQLHPDGGRRIPEAEKAYRCTLCGIGPSTAPCHSVRHYRYHDQ